jgi:plasmid maintenance system antidote protein VapI
MSYGCQGNAPRLSRVLGMSADFWLGLQQSWDLWHAMNNPQAENINHLKPILSRNEWKPTGFR